MTDAPTVQVTSGQSSTATFAVKPNWIQDAEAIAKADINRLEHKIALFVSGTRGAIGISTIAFLMSVIALFRTCH